MTTVAVTPTLGSAPVTLQAGSYSAIDDRRFWGSPLDEGYLSTGSYQVIQRAAGANMSVDVQMSSGSGCIVTGDSVTAQGRYFVPPTASNGNVTIAAADATNPRNDLVVLEVKDDQHDAGGLNQARVRVITGTANASAAATDPPGTNGTPALPVSCMPLAVVRVQAGDTSIVTSRINDRRPVARPYSRLAFTEKTTASTTSSTHTTQQDGSDPLSVSVTYGASRVLRATYKTGMYAPGGANSTQSFIVRTSTTVATFVFNTNSISTTGSSDRSVSFVFNGPVNGATETFKVQIAAQTNNTQISDFGSATTPRQLIIEDLGPQ